MITYSTGYIKYNVDQFKFPGGEVGIKLTSVAEVGWGRDTANDLIVIHAALKNSDDVMALLLTVDAIRRQNPFVELALYLPYVPYARQDRSMVEGDSLSIAVMARLINSCGFKRVKILDPHSDVTPALINNVQVVPQEEIFHKIKTSWANTWIVAPDAGAYKKAHRFAGRVNAAGVITCSKDRDVSTGQITGMSFTGDIRGKTLLVLDDIGDGMRTFIELANLLKAEEPAQLDLAITHGIFSKGVECFRDLYDNVTTTNSFHPDREGIVDGVRYLPVF